MSGMHSAQHADIAGSEYLMAVRATDPVFTLIVLGRPAIVARLRNELGGGVVACSSPFEAIAELGLVDPRGGTACVIDSAMLGREDVLQLVVALRKVEPSVRIVCVGERTPLAGVDAVISADATRDQWQRAIHPPHALPHLVDAGAFGDADPGDADRWADEIPMLSALLAGRDVLGTAHTRLRRALAPHEVSIIPVVQGHAEPQWERGYLHVPAQHRGRTLAWINGPECIRARLESMAGWLGTWLAVQEQHAALKAAALTDALTGAWNRRYFDRFLGATLARAKRRRHDVTLLLFDIDDFKTYNDRHGHASGDEILRETVRLLGSVIRPTDRVCRLGGDEFAVIFDAPDGPRDPSSRHPAGIVEVARRFQRQIRAHRFPTLGAEEAGGLSISAGLATFPWDASDATGLFDVADRHLLESKKHGKNRLTLGPGSAAE